MTIPNVPPKPLFIVDRRSEPLTLGYMTALLCLNCLCYHIDIYTVGIRVQRESTCPVCGVHGATENKGVGKVDDFFGNEKLQQRVVLEFGGAFVITSEPIMFTGDGMVTYAAPIAQPKRLCAGIYDSPEQEQKP